MSLLLAKEAPRGRGFGEEARHQAWDSGFGNTRAAKCWKGWKRGAESGLGLRFWQHEEVPAWSVCIFQAQELENHWFFKVIR